jgi:hypothetical protein
VTTQELTARANELYEERNKLARLYYRLDLRTLKRLNRLVEKLDDAQVVDLVKYAEGLAAWGPPDSHSEDGPQVDPTATAGG